MRKFIATTIREYLNEQQSFSGKALYHSTDITNTINILKTGVIKTYENILEATIMENGGVVKKGTIVYHGSKTKFEKFDKNKLSTGEGSDLFGKGFYLTDNKDLAKFYSTLVAKKDYIKGYKPTGVFGTPEPVYLPNADELAKKSICVNEFTVKGKVLDATTFIIDKKFQKYITDAFVKHIGFGADSAEKTFNFLKNNKDKIHHFRGELEYIIKQLGMGNEDMINDIISYIKREGYDGIKYESDKSFEGSGSNNYVIYNDKALQYNKSY